MDTFAQKVVACLLETGPPWGHLGDSAAQVLTAEAAAVQGPAHLARPASAVSAALGSGLLALGLGVCTCESRTLAPALQGSGGAPGGGSLKMGRCGKGVRGPALGVQASNS